MMRGLKWKRKKQKDRSQLGWRAKRRREIQTDTYFLDMKNRIKKEKGRKRERERK
jgi:hypothetical protein